MTKLSIIVPVYNVEKYIRPCIESIFRQGLDDADFEVIIVNDGTKDRSMEIISSIISQHKNITVINQENQGLSVARNNGIKKAIGNYILFVDSDDLIVDHCLPFFLEKAIPSNADLIVADFKRMEDYEIDLLYKKPLSIQNNSKVHEKTGLTLFMEDLNPRECYVWRTIYRRDFLIKNNILFIPNICYEDIPFTHECYLKADKCLRIHCPIYIYRIGHASITTAINKKTGKDFGTVIAKTWELRNLDGLPSKVRMRLDDNVFATVSVLLYAVTHDVQQSSDKRAIIKHLKVVAPNIRFSHGKKQVFVNFIYQNMPFTYIFLRSFYVNLSKKFLQRK